MDEYERERDSPLAPKPERQWGVSVAEAIRFMHPEALRQALLTESPDAILGNGMTALTMAAQFEDSDLGLARAILDAGARLDLCDSAGRSPLLSCVERRHEAMARELLRRGARTGGQDGEGRSALMLCCQMGMDGLARDLLAKRADPDLKTHEGRSPLMAYCMRTGSDQSDLGLARALLAAGADIDAADDAGATALVHAARVGNEPLAMLLFDAGAGLASRAGSANAVETAVAFGYPGLADKLLAALARRERSEFETQSGPAAFPRGPTKRI